MSITQFDYRMKLHYSQTFITAETADAMFDYRMKLHYSQTKKNKKKNCNSFTYQINYT